MRVPDNEFPAADLNLSNQSADVSRRLFLMIGMGLVVAGCTSSRTAMSLPSPAWQQREMPPLEPSLPTTPAPAPGMANVIARAQWAKGAPVPALMNPMLPVQYVTVHHDGMEPFYATDQRASAQRLERIRAGHREKGWGDIGYHFAIDRDGRIWQGRPLNWQGAHVKDHNEGNIGVVALGNFDRQAPTPQQIAALNRHVSLLMRQFKVPLKRLRTHQEWAPTACPGMNLQRYMVAVRSNQQIG